MPHQQQLILSKLTSARSRVQGFCTEVVMVGDNRYEIRIIKSTHLVDCQMSAADLKMRLHHIRELFFMRFLNDTLSMVFNTFNVSHSTGSKFTSRLHYCKLPLYKHYRGHTIIFVELKMS